MKLTIMLLLLLMIAVLFWMFVDHNENERERKQAAAEHNLTTQEVDARVAKQLAKIEPAQKDQNDTASDFSQRNTENRANDLLLQLPKSKQPTALAAAVAEGCKGTRAFYMGISPTDRVAYWSVGCTNGKSYEVAIHPDAAGSTDVVDCGVLALANIKCFQRLDTQ